MNYCVLSVLVGLGLWDIYLSAKDKPTLSQMYQKLLPTWADLIVFACGLTGLCFWKYYWPELDFTLAVVMAGFFGHVTFPNKERYGK